MPGAWDTALRRPVARTTFNTPDMFCWSDAEQVPAPCWMDLQKRVGTAERRVAIGFCRLPF